MGRYKKPSDRSRKRERGAPTFVHTIPLRATPKKLKLGETRFEVARLQYNACLGECFRRVEKIFSDPRWEKVQAMPKQVAGVSNPERSALYAELRLDHGFSERALMSYGSSLRKHFIREHVGSQEAQDLACRAYRAANDWFSHKRGRPRFKRAGHGLHSLTVKDANGDIRIAKDGSSITWAGVYLPFVLDTDNPVLWWAALHVAAGRLLRVGITRPIIRGQPTYKALLVFNGVPLQRYEVGSEKITLDPGLDYANVVSDTGCYREQLAGANSTDSGIEFDRAYIRRLSRRLDREHREGSPECFNKSGTHISHNCHWKIRSASARHTQAQLAEAHRVMAAHRKSLHGNLENRILALGADVTAEKNSYKSFQRNYGRSVRDRAPGGFITGLLRKAESAGGRTREGDPRKPAPFQSCVCGARKKKPLSQRVHACECGAGPIQRDVFSAYLWRHIKEDGTLDAPKAQAELSRRKDISVHAASGEYKQRVPLAQKRYGRVGGRVPALELLAAKPQNPVPHAGTVLASPVVPETGSATSRAAGRASSSVAGVVQGEAPGFGRGEDVTPSLERSRSAMPQAGDYIREIRCVSVPEASTALRRTVHSKGEVHDEVARQRRRARRGPHPRRPCRRHGLQEAVRPALLFAEVRTRRLGGP